jgi:tetratricopeptide (TPR) repeat protein
MSSILSIFCLGIVVYINTFNGSFHFDDRVYIINNIAIKSIQNLLHFWKFYPCRFITFLSLAVNYHFNGLHVFGYHVFNLAIHLGTAVLVWWLTLLTLSTPAMREDKITRHANLIALLAGLVFVSHPLQTEAVTYIWQRTASMAALFYLASLCLYVKSMLMGDGKGYAYYVLSLVIAVIAMFTKENTVTLPLMVLLYEISFFGPWQKLNWRRLLPFLLTLFIIPLTILFTKAEQFQAIQKFMHSPGGTSPWEYLLTQFRVITTYIRLIFLPFNQNLDYDYSISKSIFEWPVLFSFLFLAGILYWAQCLFAKYRLISFSIWWFFLTLSLESSVFPLKNVIFEHRLYLPMAGYSMFLVSGVFYLTQKSSIRAAVMVLTVIIGANSILTYQRNKVWQSEFTLWDDTVRKSPHKARAFDNRGFAYFSQGDLMEALSDYDKAIDLDPDLADAYVGRGLIYADQNKFVQAISDYDRAIQINPDFADAYNNRGIFYLHQGDAGQAIADLSKAISLDAVNVKAYYNRGLGYTKEGNFVQAVADYNQTIKLDPDYADAYYNRGLSFAQQNFFTEAILDFNKVIEIDPDYVDAYNNRGITYAYQGHLTQAIADFDRAIKINPHDAQAYNNRTMAYEQIKQNNSAWEGLEKEVIGRDH